MTRLRKPTQARFAAWVADSPNRAGAHVEKPRHELQLGLRVLRRFDRSKHPATRDRHRHDELLRQMQTHARFDLTFEDVAGARWKWA